MSGRGGVLRSEQVDSGRVDLQPFLPLPAVGLEVGVLVLQLRVGVGGPGMRRPLLVLFDHRSRETVFEIGGLVSEVPALDVGLDGQLRDVQPSGGALRRSRFGDASRRGDVHGVA